MDPSCFAYLFSVPPEIAGRPEGDISINEGKRIELKCETKGSPLPTLEWKGASGKVIDADSGNRFSIIDDTLVIDPVRPEDEGDWSCTAENVAGSDEWSFTVGVLGELY